MNMIGVEGPGPITITFLISAKYNTASAHRDDCGVITRRRAARFPSTRVWTVEEAGIAELERELARIGKGGMRGITHQCLEEWRTAW